MAQIIMKKWVEGNQLKCGTRRKEGGPERSKRANGTATRGTHEEGVTVTEQDEEQKEPKSKKKVKLRGEATATAMSCK